MASQKRPFPPEIPPGSKTPLKKKKVLKSAPSPEQPETEYDYTGNRAAGDFDTFPAVKKTPWWSTLIQCIFLVIVFGIIFYLIKRHWGFDILNPNFPTLAPATIIFLALSFSFTWVRILKWGVTKPFNCVKCMTGWTALIFAFLFHAEFPVFYLFTGLFIGAMFEAISMRWL